MKTLTADVNGPVHYADFGGDGHPLLLVHGLGGSLLNWAEVGPALSKLGHVMALDLPGFGRTPPAGRSVSVRSQVDLVARFIDKVAGGRCTIMGNSMGGMIAAAVASLHGEKVSRLVLVNPVLPRVAGVRGDPIVVATFVAYMIPGVGELLIRARRRLTPRQQIDQQLGLCGIETSRLPPLLVDAMMAQVEYRRTTDWADRSFLAAARSVSRWTLFRADRHGALLDAVRCPTLLVHGTRDRLVPVDLARQAARRRPQWDTAILEGVGHVPQLEVPERFIEVVRRWVGPTTEVTEAPHR